ncbi:MAG: hypothetical protein LUE27_06770 [Clostridia bacterium]|nr:hypothetical protein [Clostridia bacterium]
MEENRYSEECINSLFEGNDYHRTLKTPMPAHAAVDRELPYTALKQELKLAKDFLGKCRENSWKGLASVPEELTMWWHEEVRILEHEKARRRWAKTVNQK